MLSRVRIQTLCFTACGQPSGLVNLPATWAHVRFLLGWGQPWAPVQPPAGRGGCPVCVVTQGWVGAAGKAGISRP
eukprot:1851992-Alexandrium_andersonii.AAC.1